MIGTHSESHYPSFTARYGVTADAAADATVVLRPSVRLGLARLARFRTLVTEQRTVTLTAIVGANGANWRTRCIGRSKTGSPEGDDLWRGARIGRNIRKGERKVIEFILMILFGQEPAR